jgi:hypothetical protein
MLAQGYAPVQIKEMLKTSYVRIRRYATGDPAKMCRFGGERVPEAARYRNEIIGLLEDNLTLKQSFEQITSIGYKGKRTAFEVYCRKLVSELGIQYAPKRNLVGATLITNPAKPKVRYASKADVLKHLWSGKELVGGDMDYILGKYPNISEIEQCILDFRKIYDDSDVGLLEQFIERFSTSQIAPIKSFAAGLRLDIKAVRNSITSELSNGFVEGNINKIKAIKRTMFGRAKVDLLRVKVLFAR